jgi:hypothetical protein
MVISFLLSPCSQQKTKEKRKATTSLCRRLFSLQTKPKKERRRRKHLLFLKQKKKKTHTHTKTNHRKEKKCKEGKKFTILLG